MRNCKSGKEELKICLICSLQPAYSICPKAIGEKKKHLKKSRSSSVLNGGYETVGPSQEETQNPHRNIHYPQSKKAPEYAIT